MVDREAIGQNHRHFQGIIVSSAMNLWRIYLLLLFMTVETAQETTNATTPSRIDVTSTTSTIMSTSMSAITASGNNTSLSTSNSYNTSTSAIVLNNTTALDKTTAMLHTIPSTNETSLTVTSTSSHAVELSNSSTSSPGLLTASNITTLPPASLPSNNLTLSTSSAISTSKATQPSNETSLSQATATSSNITILMPTSSPSNTSTLSTSLALSTTETMHTSNTSTSSQVTSQTSNITTYLSISNTSTLSESSTLSTPQTMQTSNTSASSQSTLALTSNSTTVLPAISPLNTSTLSASSTPLTSQTMHSPNTSASSQDTSQTTSNITTSLSTLLSSNTSTLSTSSTPITPQAMQSPNVSTSSHFTSATTSNITTSRQTSSPSNTSASSSSTLFTSQATQSANSSTSSQVTSVTTSNITTSLPTSTHSNTSTLSINSTLLTTQTLQSTNMSSSQVTSTTSNITSLHTSSPSNASLSTSSTLLTTKDMQSSNTSASSDITSATTSNITTSLSTSLSSNTSTLSSSTLFTSHSSHSTNSSTSPQVTSAASNISDSTVISSSTSSSVTLTSTNTSSHQITSAATSNITTSHPTTSNISDSTVNSSSTSSPVTLTSTNTSSHQITSAATSNITTSHPTTSNISDSTVNSSSTSSSVTLTPTNTSSHQITSAATSNITTSHPTTSNISDSTVNSSSTSSSVTLTSTNTTSRMTTLPSTTTAIPTAVVPLEFKIVNKNFTEDLKNKSSEAYINFTSNVENQYSIRVEVYSDGIPLAVIYQLPVNGYRSHVTYQCHVTTGRHSANVTGTAYVWELTSIYQEKFSNFKSATVIALSQGSVIATTELEFENSTVPVPSSDNTVRALVSSLQSNNFVGDLQLNSESISSNGVNLSNLAPLDVSISFLILIPYNQSSQDILKTQANNWVNNSLLLLPNITTSENASVTFTNNSGWTLYSVVFPIITPLLFDVDAALGNFTSNRKNAQFTIVPSTLTIQGKSATLNTISPPLRLLDVPQSLDLATKSSATFQQYSTAIEDSFNDIFGEQQVEPIVTGFTNDPLSRMVSVELYFPSDAINKTTVINKMEANIGTFTNRNLNLDLFLLDPKVGVQVTSSLMQDYTSNLSNASSSETIERQNTVLGLLTPELRTFYGNSLQDPPSVSFSNSSDGLAAMDINYILNYTTNVDSSLLLASLINNTGLINIIRISSLSVNDITPVIDVFTLKPRFINQDYSAYLKDRNSTRFTGLENNITQGLNGILKDFNVIQIFVLSFQQGSVISTVETTFPSGATSYSQVTQAIVNKKDNLAGLNLSLDPQSLYTSPVAPTNPPPGSSVPGYGVAIIVMCILLILAIPLVIVLALKTDLCRRLSNACSLKPPYERYHGVNAASALTNYRTHSYDFPH